MAIWCFLSFTSLTFNTHTHTHIKQTQCINVYILTQNYPHITFILIKVATGAKHTNITLILLVLCSIVPRQVYKINFCSILYKRKLQHVFRDRHTSHIQFDSQSDQNTWQKLIIVLITPSKQNENDPGLVSNKQTYRQRSQLAFYIHLRATTRWRHMCGTLFQVNIYHYESLLCIQNVCALLTCVLN